VGLKNVKSNGENVVSSNLIKVIFLCLKIVKIEFQNKDHMLFFLKDAMIAQKAKFFIMFTLEINVE
jgi:hypothetical protein